MHPFMGLYINESSQEESTESSECLNGMNNVCSVFDAAVGVHEKHNERSTGDKQTSKLYRATHASHSADTHRATRAEIHNREIEIKQENNDACSMRLTQVRCIQHTT